jgi:hypothetical protein
MDTRDKLSNRAEETLHRAGGSENLERGIHKGAEAANRVSGGKHKEHVERAETGAKKAVGKLSRKKKNK